MKTVPATSASFHVNVGSDSEEEVPQLVRRSRASRGDLVLGTKGEHLRTPSQSSLLPQRPAPYVPTAGMPSASGPGERMLEVKDIRLRTQPTAWPMPQRSAPLIPTAGTPQAAPPGTGQPTPSIPAPRGQAAGTVEPWLMQWLDRQPETLQTLPSDTPLPTRPAPAVPTPGAPESPPISPMPPLRRTAKADAEKSQPLPDEKGAMPIAQKPVRLPPQSPKAGAVPSRPVSPEPGSPVVPRRDGKQPMPLSPPGTDRASTSAAPPDDTGPASPIAEARHPAEVAQAGELAESFAADIEELLALRVPRTLDNPFAERNELVGVRNFLKAHKHLLDTDSLRQAQVCLKSVLENADLGAVGPRRLAELQAVAEVDLRAALRPLRQLNADYAKIYDCLVNELGCDPSLLTRRARPLAEIQAERDRQLAEDNAAIAARQYPFH